MSPSDWCDMSDDANRSELIDKWDKIFRDICREIVCPPSVDDQPVDGPHLEIGWQRDAGDFDEKGLLQSVADGYEEFWDAEDDAHAQTMLGAAGEFDLDAEGAADDPSQFADFGLAFGVGDSMFDKSAGPGNSGFFGKDVLGVTSSGLTEQSEMLSSGSEWYDPRWCNSKWSPSGWLERCLCEPVEEFFNEDPMHPWDTSTLCTYRGPWRRKCEPIILGFQAFLIVAGGAAIFYFAYLCLSFFATAGTVSLSDWARLRLALLVVLLALIEVRFLRVRVGVC